MSETSGIAQARASNQWMVNGDFGFDLKAGGQWQILEDTGNPPITQFFLNGLDPIHNTVLTKTVLC